MRRLAAALLVGIALVGAVYLASLHLGPYLPFSNINMGGLNGHIRGPASVPVHEWAGWQIPVSILIGVLGVAGGLLVLRTRSKQPQGNSTQAA